MSFLKEIENEEEITHRYADFIDSVFINSLKALGLPSFVSKEEIEVPDIEQKGRLLGLLKPRTNYQYIYTQSPIQINSGEGLIKSTTHQDLNSKGHKVSYYVRYGYTHSKFVFCKASQMNDDETMSFQLPFEYKAFFDDPQNITMFGKHITNALKSIYAHHADMLNKHILSDSEKIPDQISNTDVARVLDQTIADSIEEYFGLSHPRETLAITLETRETMDETRKSQISALCDSKKYQVHRLVSYGLEAEASFRKAVSDIQSWNRSRINQLPPSLLQAIHITEIMKGYKKLEVDEKAQVADQFLTVLDSIHPKLEMDIPRLSQDCETTDSAAEILEDHRSNIDGYINALRANKDGLSAIFGEAAIDDKITDLKTVKVHTGIQIANSLSVQQTYNIGMMTHTVELTRAFSKLSETTHRLSIITKLRNLITDNGVASDIATEALKAAGISQDDTRDIKEHSKQDLDNAIDEIFEEINETLSPIINESQQIEIKMIEGRPYGQLLLPAPQN